jgi:hypothetical protein
MKYNEMDNLCEGDWQSNAADSPWNDRLSLGDRHPFVKISEAQLREIDCVPSANLCTASRPQFAVLPIAAIEELVRAVRALCNGKEVQPSIPYPANMSGRSYLHAKATGH